MYTHTLCFPTTICSQSTQLDEPVQKPAPPPEAPVTHASRCRKRDNPFMRLLHQQKHQALQAPPPTTATLQRPAKKVRFATTVPALPRGNHSVGTFTTQSAKALSPTPPTTEQSAHKRCPNSTTRVRPDDPPAVTPHGDAPPTERKRKALFGTSTAQRPPKKTRATKHDALRAYDREHGTHHNEHQGKLSPTPMSHPVGNRNTTTHTGTDRGSHYTSIYNVAHDDPDWKKTIPTPSALLSRGFGRPDKAHSCTQVASFETTLIIFLKYGDGYLPRRDLENLLNQHTLIRHMYRMIPVMANYDFTWI